MCWPLTKVPTAYPGASAPISTGAHTHYRGSRVLPLTNLSLVDFNILVLSTLGSE
ncbi:hypothetical protein F2P79_018039 [Pimephales promelas]|nr:hypothetical protein F2P79_018039 [Pimephales promelas]